ncbi:hypothetical protein AKO1_014536 [Acrasis kona]|uniref:Uncharacterized protein n=1 Tax=Acrasis kona TaxID=1008807 RepID=A0AAW2Z2J0_9EUKA
MKQEKEVGEIEQKLKSSSIHEKKSTPTKEGKPKLLPEDPTFDLVQGTTEIRYVLSYGKGKKTDEVENYKNILDAVRKKLKNKGWDMKGVSCTAIKSCTIEEALAWYYWLRDARLPFDRVALSVFVCDYKKQ